MEAQEVTPAQEAAAGPEPPAAARERHAALSTEIDDNQYLQQEAEIMQRLREVREWRERFGMSVGGGPVRVAESDDAE